MSIAAVPLEDGSLGGTASDVAVTVGSVLTAWAVATVWTDEAAVLVAVVFRSAQAGESWAVGVAVALGAVVLSITLQVVAFVLSLALGGRGGR